MNSQYSRYYTFIKPIVRNRNVQTYSTLAFNLVAIAIFLVFAIQPTIATILSLQKSISDQQKILDQLNTKAANLSLGKQNLQKISPSTLTILNTLVPDKTEVTTLTDSLNNAALQNQASVSGLQIQPTLLIGNPTKLNKSPHQQKIKFTLNLTGAYPVLISTLDSLNNTERLISIDSLNFNQSENTLVLSVNGKAYYLQN